MTLTITPTEKITHLDGVPCRLWEGTAPDGTPVKVFVHRVAVPATADNSAFERVLQEQVPPGRVVPLAAVL